MQLILSFSARIIFSFVLAVSLMPLLKTIPAFAAEGESMAARAPAETFGVSSKEPSKTKADIVDLELGEFVDAAEGLADGASVAEDTKSPTLDSSGVSGVEEVVPLSEESIEVVSQAIKPTPGWTQCGECEWQIDEGTLTVRPISGGTARLACWDFTSSPWRGAHIVSAVFEPGVKAQTCGGMFWSCSALTSLDLSGLDTSDVTDMSYMFNSCSSLATLDLSSLNTARAQSMYNMFAYCSSLTNLDLSGLETSHVTNMIGMFFHCSSITALDLSGFDTSNLIYMGSMFAGCTSLTVLNLTGFGAPSLINMPEVFNGCSSLATLNLTDFNASNVTLMSGMFNGCSSLASLDISSFDTSNVIKMEEMFGDCGALAEFKVGDGYKACELDGIPEGKQGGRWWSSALGAPMKREQVFNRSNKADTYLANVPKCQISKNFSGENLGAVTLIDSADGTKATLYPYAGDIVTFRTSPKTGYTLTRMSYTTASGKTVGLKRISGTGKAGTNSVYSFTMPAENVTLNAAFDMNRHKITKSITGSGTMQIIAGSGDATMNPQVGAKVRFRVVPSAGYKLSKCNYTLSSTGKTLALTRVPGTTNVYEFTMPNEDVRLNGVFVRK